MEDNDFEVKHRESSACPVDHKPGKETKKKSSGTESSREDPKKKPTK